MITQGVMEQGSSSVAYVVRTTVAKPLSRPRDMSNVECYNCHKFGHVASQCKFCRYCKKPGHTIETCRTRPPRRQNAACCRLSCCASSCSSESDPHSRNGTANSFICFLYSTLGLQGKSLSSAITWFMDSGATNHISFNSHGLHNVRKYERSSQVIIASLLNSGRDS